MKKSIKLVALAAIALGAATTTSCNKEPGREQDRQAVQFKAGITGQLVATTTRASETTWDAGDGIGVFMAEHGTANVVNNAADRIYYTPAGDGNFMPLDAPNTIFYPANGSAVDFYAYYFPNAGSDYHWTAATLNADNRFGIPGNQSSGHSGYDLLWAKADGGGAGHTSGTPALNFKHVLSKLTFDVGSESNADLAGLTVYITGLFRNVADFDMTTGEAVANNRFGNYDIYPHTVETGRYDALLVPATYPAGAITVDFKLGVKSYLCTLPATTFAGGNNYVYTVTLRDTVIPEAIITTSEIEPWTDNDGGAFELNYASYHAGDVAVVNAIIDNNGLAWTKDAPFAWPVTAHTSEGGAVWSHDAVRCITDLDLFNQNLTGMPDVSGLKNLTSFSVRANWLGTIDVSANTNTALKSLDVAYNNLTSLDISAKTELNILHVDYNSLTSLDISANTKLNVLNCEDNEMDGEALVSLLNSLPLPVDSWPFINIRDNPGVNGADGTVTPAEYAAAKAAATDKGWQVIDE